MIWMQLLNKHKTTMAKTVHATSSNAEPGFDCRPGHNFLLKGFFQQERRKRLKLNRTPLRNYKRTDQKWPERLKICKRIPSKKCRKQ